MKSFLHAGDIGDLGKALEEAVQVKENPFGWKELGKDRTIILIFFNSSLYQLQKICMVCICTCSLGYLKDNGALELACRLCDTLNDLHVVYIESADSITAVICLLEHFGCGN